MLMAATNDVEPSESGLASGVVNTAFMMGGAVGLAVLAALAAMRWKDLVAAGDTAAGALTGSYHVAFLVGAVFVVVAAAVATFVLRVSAPQPHGEPEPQPSATS